MIEKIINLPWHVPFGELSLRLDPLSLVFLIAITILTICTGIYGAGYMRRYAGNKPLWIHSFFFALYVSSLVVIVTANNVILFLAAYEVMSITTYFLIIFHDEKPSVRKAGFLYLIATHCGTFCLFLMFFLMARVAGSMNFDAIARVPFPAEIAVVIFLMSLAGFGVKAGFVPMHIWLPQAHPAAPPHISALLSGVAIKIGIYGICRILFIIGVLPAWCAYLLMLIGCVSGILGVLYAIGQHELKRLLAYHSIENIGIITIGIGLGSLGLSCRVPFIAILGFGGGLLHVLNHSLFKGLLFLGAGSVIQKTHSGEMDQLGGLSKTMPATSILFMVGSLSICGLPLFNGFISEFIIYFGLFQGLLMLPLAGKIFCSIGILSLALMGTLALACFSKVYGTVFSGMPRAMPQISVEGENLPKSMLIPMIVLAALCIWIGLDPKPAVWLTFFGGAYMTKVGLTTIDLAQIFMPLAMIIKVVVLFLVVIFGLVALRRLLLGSSPMPVRETWGCGFTQVSARLQYTSSSFARPIVEFARNILLFHRNGGQATGLFPGKAHMSSSVHDASEEKLFRPLLEKLTNISRRVDNNRIRYTQMYLMYILLFLIFLLIWKLI